MKPYVFNASSLEQLDTKIREYRHGEVKPALAIVFSAIAFNMNAIRQLFLKYNMNVFGASSAGEIANGELFQDSVSVMVLDPDRGAYRIKIFDRQNKSSFDAGMQAGTWATQVFDDPAILVISYGYDTDGDQLVSGIKSGAGRTIPVFGGFAGNDLKPSNSLFVFDIAEANSCAVAVLAFDQKVVRLTGLTVCGWKGIGTSKTITKSAGNVVSHIDHRPAMEFYQKYLNVYNTEDLARTNETGLAVERPDGSTVMRAAVVINEDNSIVYAGSMPEGAKVRLCAQPGLEITKHTIDRLKEFHDHEPDADAGILFSCISRLMALGSLVEEETKAISEIWKVPYHGFFTFGEIGHGTKGECDFHNFTLSLVLLKEN
jgi:hypothetical protein